MKVIIAGSRSITEYGYVEEAVEKSGFYISKIIHGDANGVDKNGGVYAYKNDIPVKVFPADWKNLDAPGAVIKSNRYGKYNAAAGIKRNRDMGDYADALIAVWDGESKGTRYMIDYMRLLNKPVFVYDISRV